MKTTFTYNSDCMAFVGNQSSNNAFSICNRGRRLLEMPETSKSGDRLIVSRQPFQGATQIHIDKQGFCLIKGESLLLTIEQCLKAAHLITGKHYQYLDESLSLFRQLPKPTRFYVKYEGAAN